MNRRSPHASSPVQIRVAQHGPIRIGELLPAALARYGLTSRDPIRPARRPDPMQAIRLSHQLLSRLET